LGDFILSIKPNVKDKIANLNRKKDLLKEKAVKDALVKQNLENIEKSKAVVAEKSGRLQRYVSEMVKDDIKLSWNDLVELSVKFANEKDEEFYRFIRANYESLKIARELGATYTPPAGVVVSTSDLAVGVAAVLGIGIGWVWAWLAVSPWSSTKTK